MPATPVAHPSVRHRERPRVKWNIQFMPHASRPIAPLLATTVLALVSTVSLPAHADPPELTVWAWSPDEDWSTFKAAAVCHDQERDVYGIAAVFEVFDNYLGGFQDYVHYLQIEGNSSASEYGQVISDQVLAVAPRIDHIDCATDDQHNVFVTYDHHFENAQWVRIDGTEVYGPFDVDLALCNPYTHRPRIAFGGGDRVIVATEGWHYECDCPGGGDDCELCEENPWLLEWASCEVCAQQYDAYSGEEIYATEIMVWPTTGSTHTDYDVEWGDEAFILAAPYTPDTLPDHPIISTWFIDLESRPAPSPPQPPETFIQDVGDEPEPGWPERIKLVRSNNDNNEGQPMFMRTDAGSYWLDGAGQLIDVPVPDAIDPQMAVCEYWGSDPGVAHVFTKDPRVEYIGTYPTGYFRLYYGTSRHHYGPPVDYPYESIELNRDFVPEACDGSDTYDDPEVALVSGSSMADPFVYWMLLENDD